MAKENELADSELREYKHLARIKQVLAICEELSGALSTEIESKRIQHLDSARALFELCMTSPILNQDPEVKLDKARMIIEHTSKVAIINIFILELVKASRAKSRS